MKGSWRMELPQWLLLIAMFALAALTWSSVPDRIPVHWNLQGEIDRYGSRFEGLLLVPIVALGVYLTLALVPLLRPDRSDARVGLVFGVVRLICLLGLFGIHVAMVLGARGHHVAVGTLLPLLLGGMFLLLAPVIARIPPNRFFGIRTPWTLASPAAWRSTHRLGAWLFVVMGLSLVAGAWVEQTAPKLILLLVIPLVALFLLVTASYWSWRRDPARRVGGAPREPDGPAQG